jgi:hypothetical protein
LDVVAGALVGLAGGPPTLGGGVVLPPELEHPSATAKRPAALSPIPKKVNAYESFINASSVFPLARVRSPSPSVKRGHAKARLQRSFEETR